MEYATGLVCVPAEPVRVQDVDDAQVEIVYDTEFMIIVKPFHWPLGLKKFPPCHVTAVPEVVTDPAGPPVTNTDTWHCG
jgi:hypothetical protein